MDIDKLIKRLKCPRIQSCPMNGENISCKACQMSIEQDVITEFSTLQAENEKIREELEQLKQCIEIVEKQRNSAIKELENYMMQDVFNGNEPCEICAKASDIPCEYCNPKWRGMMEG